MSVWQFLTENLDLGLILYFVVVVIYALVRGDVGSETGEDVFDDPENISPADRVRKIQDDLGNPLK